MVLVTDRGVLIHPYGGDGVGWTRDDVLEELSTEIGLEGEIGMCSADIVGREDCARQMEVWGENKRLCPTAGSLLWWGVWKGEGVRAAKVGKSQGQTVIEGFDVGQ